MKKIIAANWKLHKTKNEAGAFVETLKSFLSTEGRHLLGKVDTIICPSPTLMDHCGTLVQQSPVRIFSQNVSYAESGAFTGEISPAQILDSKCQGTLIAHSERRQFFGETDESALKRALCALKNNLDIIYCVGENLQERQNNQTESVLKRQISRLCTELLPQLSKPGSFMIAYEPVWAIGTSLVATEEQIVHAHDLIHQSIKNASSQKIPLLYGGSVKPENLKNIIGLKNVDGALVGGASLKIEAYIELLKVAAL